MTKESELVELNGISTYYEAHGSGEPLVLLHGWTETSNRWQALIPHYAARFRVYAFDLLGHGRSDPLQGTFSIQSAAENLLHLLDHLKIDQTKAIGFSYGGETLLQFACKHAYRLSSMILVGASYNFPAQDWGLDFNNLSSEWLGSLREEHIHGEQQIEQIFSQMFNYEIVLTESQLEEITPSTLVIQGEHDEFNDLAIPFQLRKSLPDSHLWIVPNAGHFAFAGEYEPEFLRISMKFLCGEWN
ncbi:MAG: alpha/beta hydrolase [Caldilineaceae bacterium]|nr:alpha/beta hydrolase [Caldilineaceae bacterium]